MFSYFALVIVLTNERIFLVYGFVYVLKSSKIIHLQTDVPNDYWYVGQLIIR
ncbi:MAG: hypothetical protein IPF75_02620 [Bacteroidetes bacterium]|nr:hypothetical protein [Bacteroidota bacterium]